ncbi:hypothetical protein chiPu_0002601 [Chiloscyllium punctatum]|uniref:Uncharacterized protein n=1 Tax=Chiloscyllium punctatum TaxID=137246 RepID=A0A401S1B9_CHIPU|nr:hypothetical protein [Chiloscyllium punctatum]
MALTIRRLALSTRGAEGKRKQKHVDFVPRTLPQETTGRDKPCRAREWPETDATCAGCSSQGLNECSARVCNRVACSPLLSF